MRFAKGARVVAMYEDRSISKEIYDSIRRELDVAWKRAVPRVHPGVLLPGERARAQTRAQKEAADLPVPKPPADEAPQATAVDGSVNIAEDPQGRA
jgi:CPA1 family monovalent cation:H+ antiporter